MKMLLAVLIVTIVALSFPIQVSAITAGELKQYCTNNGKGATLENALCFGYIQGWMDGTVGMSIPIGNKMSTVFFEDNVTVGQIVDVYLKYMNNHPEYENKTAHFGLIYAITNAKLVKFIPVAEASQTH